MAAITQEEVDDKIIQAKTELLAALGGPGVLSVTLQARLQQMGVITDDLKDEMEPVYLTPKRRVDLLLDDFQYGPVWRFLHFCKVMHEEGKSQVLEALDMDIRYIEEQLELAAAEGDLPEGYKWRDDTFPSERPDEPSLPRQVLGFVSRFFIWPITYVVNLLRPGTVSVGSSRPQSKRHFYQHDDSSDKSEISPHMLPALLQHCEAMERTLMQTRLFDFSDDDLLDVTELYINTDVSVKQNQREQTRISLRESFSQLFQLHEPNTLLLEGEAGSGKSSLLRQYTYNFCKQFLDCHNKGPKVPCEGHMWQLVVYIGAGLIDTSAEQAIKNGLKCKMQFRKQLMNAITQNGAGVLVIKDGMDELRNAESIKSIRKYTKDCQQNVGKPKVLLSARNGLSQIEMVLFDRVLTAEGFTLNQGLTYVEKYFKLRHNLTHHPVLEHVRANKEDLEWVLRNPLQALIFSELTARGELTVHDIGTLSRVKLLKVFEMHIIRRDAECRLADTTEGCALQFYKLCLECLLNDKRKMTENDVMKASPHMAFLNKYKHTDLYANTQNHFMFGHEMFREFFSVQGLIQCLKSNSPNKQAVLLYLTSKPTMRNAVLLTCGYISEYEPELFDDLIFIIQACLVLQVERQRCKINDLTEGLLQLPSMIQRTFKPSDLLTQGLTTGQATTVEDVAQRVQRAFNKDAQLMREVGWILNGYLFAGEDKFYYEHYKFIMGCIRQCTAEKQDVICSRTTHRLIPCFRCTKRSKGHMQEEAVVPVSSDRWGAIQCVSKLDGPTRTQISVWCPSDLTSTITQYTSQSQHGTQDLGSVTVYLHDHGSLWGAQPVEELTHEGWVPGLHQLLKHRVSDITIYTDHVMRTSPLDGLLTALQHVVQPVHGLTGGVTVFHGQVNEDVLKDFCDWAHEVKLEVVLWNSTITLGADHDDDAVRRLHEHVQDVARGMTYAAQDGHRVKHPERLDDTSSDGDEIDDLDDFLSSLKS